MLASPNRQLLGCKAHRALTIGICEAEQRGYEERNENSMSSPIIQDLSCHMPCHMAFHAFLCFLRKSSFCNEVSTDLMPLMLPLQFRTSLALYSRTP